IRIGYQVYAYELSVRTSHLDGSHGFFNPATLCMYVPGLSVEPLTVHVLAPEGWRVTTGLQIADFRLQITDVAPNLQSAICNLQSFVAQDYDELVDAPFECGAHRLLEFDVDGIPHRIALWGRGNEDEARLAEDTRKIVAAAGEMFGGLP